MIDLPEHAMDIKDFKSGCLKQGYKYQYFLPEMVNHDFSWKNRETFDNALFGI